MSENAPLTCGNRYNESGPGGACNATRSLTRSPDLTRKGLRSW